MQCRNQRHQIGRGFVKTPKFTPRQFGIGKADLAIKQDVRNLMGDDVEVEAERLIRTGLPIAANFNEPVTRQSVIEARLDRQLKPVKMFSKVPRYLAAEISFPDVEDETYGSEQVCCFELRCSRCEVIKMSLRIRRSRGQTSPRQGGSRIFGCPCGEGEIP